MKIAVNISSCSTRVVLICALASFNAGCGTVPVNTSDTTAPDVELRLIGYDMRDAYHDPSVNSELLIESRTASFVATIMLSGRRFTLIAKATDSESGVRYLGFSATASTVCGSLFPRREDYTVASAEDVARDPAPVLEGDLVRQTRVASATMRGADVPCPPEELWVDRIVFRVLARNYSGQESLKIYQSTMR